MDFEQKRKKHHLEWLVEEDGVRVHEVNAGVRQEFLVPFENISVVLTLSEIKPDHKPGKKKRLLISGTGFAICAIIAFQAYVTDPNYAGRDSIYNTIFWVVLAAIMFFRASKVRPCPRYISTAFSANTRPIFWFFLPTPAEEPYLTQFIDKVFDVRNAYLRNKYLGQVKVARTPYECHDLLLLLRREKVITETEFEEFRDRFIPQKPRIGF